MKFARWIDKHAITIICSTVILALVALIVAFGLVVAGIIK